MRKTKILKRLVATTFALALVLSGILPGMEPLEVQAKTVDSNELYNIEVFMKDDGITFTGDYTLDIEGEIKTYTSGATWINESDNVYYVDKEEDTTIYLKTCTFDGYKISVGHDPAMGYGTGTGGWMPIELGNTSTISISELRDRIISSSIAYGTVLSIFEDKIYKDSSYTIAYDDNDVIDVSQGEISAGDGKYDISIDVYARLDFENVPTNGPQTSSNDKKEEESKPVEQPKTPETHYGMFQEDAIRKLNVAIENVNKATTNGTTNQTKKVELNTGIWVSFHKSVYEEIQKCNVPVTITFIHEGTRYVVTIPSNANVLSLVDENGYCGFLNLGAHYGYDSIEKLW